MTEKQCSQLTRQAQVYENEDILKQLRDEMRKLAAARQEQVCVCCVCVCVHGCLCVHSKFLEAAKWPSFQYSYLSLQLSDNHLWFFFRIKQLPWRCVNMYLRLSELFCSAMFVIHSKLQFVILTGLFFLRQSD